MRLLLGTFVALLGMMGNALAADPLKLDTDKSTIEFVGKKTDGSHSGGFKKFTVNAEADWEDPSKSKMSIIIDTTSIFSDDPKLTDHLKNPDFFDVRKYPEIKFESTKIEPVSETKANITGKLTMLGKTAEVTIHCEVAPSDTEIDLTAKFEIDRTQWGMSYGVGKINKEVPITVKFIFKR
jgi:polyisoprenoid-binding protein YceI